MHGLVWEEALTLNGVDPDFHRRDLYNAIGAGAFPQWELGVQVMPDTEDQYFEGIDLLDATKLVPEELAPVQTIGTLTLNRRPTNFFAEVEQVAFHVGHLVRGIEVVDDPLMQARLFSYLDTQLTRLGGPNFDQLPINRPHAPVDDLRRDGFSQQAVHEGRTPYLPNGVGGGCPFLAPAEDGGYIHVPRAVDGPEGPRARARRPLRPGDAVLEQHDPDRAGPHRGRLHLRAVQGGGARRREAHGAPTRPRPPRPGHPGRLRPRARRSTTCPPTAEPDEVRHPDAPDASGGLTESPALAMVTEDLWPPDGRVVQILADDGADLTGLKAVRDAIVAAGAAAHVVATHKGHIAGRRKADRVLVDRSFHTASPAEADAVVVAAGAGLADEPGRHRPPPDGLPPPQAHRRVGRRHRAARRRRHRPATSPGWSPPSGPPRPSPTALLDAMAVHRHWERAPEHPTLHLVDQEA